MAHGEFLLSEWLKLSLEFSNSNIQIMLWEALKKNSNNKVSKYFKKVPYM